MDIKVIIATHKKYRVPIDKIYIPIHVGAEGTDSIGFQPDNEGNNISSKNANYCELTGLYWAWKNLSADYIGLVHYRRYFSNGLLASDKWKRIISKKELESKLKKAPVLLPKQRRYWIETNYSQYAHAHHAIDLDLTREILIERYPEYVQAFDTVMKKTYGHRFNMFIMKKNYFDQWCEWIFTVLFELEKRLDISNYSENDLRVFGFVSERLIDVWIMANNIKYADIPYVFMERQNWLVKGTNFIKRKVMFKKVNGIS